MRERFVPSVMGKAAGLVAFAVIRKESSKRKKMVFGLNLEVARVLGFRLPPPARRGTSHPDRSLGGRRRSIQTL